MSHHPTDSSGLGQAEHLAVRALELSTAAYALDHAARGTPIGEEGDFVAQAARTGGNFVIASALWHWLIVPYLCVTAILFFVLAGVGNLLLIHIDPGLKHSPYYVVAFWVGVVYLWFRYAVKRWLWRRFIRPVDAALTGRTLDDPAGHPSTALNQDPKYLAEYEEWVAAIDSRRPGLPDDAYPF